MYRWWAKGFYVILILFRQRETREGTKRWSRGSYSDIAYGVRVNENKTKQNIFVTSQLYKTQWGGIRQSLSQTTMVWCRVCLTYGGLRGGKVEYLIGKNSAKKWPKFWLVIKIYADYLISDQYFHTLCFLWFYVGEWLKISAGIN